MDVPGTKLQPQSKNVELAGMHLAQPPPPPPPPSPLPVETCAFGASLGNYPRSAPDHGPLSFFLSWSVGFAGTKTWSLRKLKTLPF